VNGKKLVAGAVACGFWAPEQPGILYVLWDLLCPLGSLNCPAVAGYWRSDVANEISDLRSGICPVCRLTNGVLRRTLIDNPANELHCARCGDYDITYRAVSELNEEKKNRTWAVSLIRKHGQFLG